MKSTEGGTIDTTLTREIAASPVRLAMMALASTAFVVGGWFMAQATASTTRHSADLINIIGYAAMAVFGLFLVIALHRLITQRGTVITISPAGLTDIRVASDIVPWHAIASLATWENQGQRIMVVSLKPGEEEKLSLTRMARMTRGANARLGADGLAVAAQGTKISHDELMSIAIAYARHYQTA